MLIRDEPQSLSALAARTVALELFRINIRWRRLKDVAFFFQDLFATWKLPRQARLDLRDAINAVMREVNRWDEKHREMFSESSGKKKTRRVLSRCEHLRTFYQHLVWKAAKFEIDDFETARHLMTGECRNWPQMQFQFACLYAMREWIEDDFRFDKYRRATLKKQLDDHPVYDFWLTLLDSKWSNFFETERRLPNQKLTQCFQFSIRHGYFQLMKFIWDRIGDNHREAVGLLQWRAMCYRTHDRDTLNFLCHKLCEINAVGVARLSWTTFFDTFYNSLNNTKDDIVVCDKFTTRMEFLIENCCPELRKRLLSMENFRVLSDAFRYNQTKTFGLLLQHLDKEQLRMASDIVDKIHNRKNSVDGERLKRALLRRQMTYE